MRRKETRKAGAESAPITFAVAGVDVMATRGGGAAVPSSLGAQDWEAQAAVRLTVDRGGGGEQLVHAVPGEDVVVLQVTGGPELVLHPETARDLLLAQAADGPGRGGPALADGAVRVPVSLRWNASQPGVAARGFLDGILLSSLGIFKRRATDTAADLGALAIARRFDGQVGNGVFSLQPDVLGDLREQAPEEAVAAAAAGEAHLVLVHGTFSSTHGTFSKLWSEHPQLVRRLFTAYGDRVLALDHPTLASSPLANAITLARAMPAGARLHLLTHSRGGLVAEALARACAAPAPSAADLAFFKGAEYKAQLEELRELTSLVARRKLQVERVVRVACPARGTLLASRRLDAFVSVFKWTMDKAQVPVLPALIEFLGAVARRRAEPDKMPGLAAQIPDSPIIRWLHAAESPLPGDLRVIAGDVKGDGVVSWLKTLVSDAFFWTDNDLVVHTRAMYGGAPRGAGAQFVFDQGGDVSHFSYFRNSRTAEAVAAGLMEQAPDGYRPIGPLSWKGESATGVRGPASRARPPRPALLVLPGILGSHLAIAGQRVWLSWRVVNGLLRLEYGRPGVSADGPIEAAYDRLIEFFGGTHDVIPFAFDWRRPLPDTARDLATAVGDAIAARAGTAHPVRILAHSMGGLVVRTMALEAPETWKRMMAIPGSRVLMLGTPNHGSWAPMQVLSGDDSVGNLLTLLGAPFQEDRARALMAGFPGFLQLQAGLLDDARGLGKAATWQQLADEDQQRVVTASSWHNDPLMLNARRWGVPSQAVLTAASALWRRLDAQRGDLGAPAEDRVLLVTGRAPLTPVGYELGEHGLEYLEVPDEGDGRVSMDSARLPGVRTWQASATHGALSTSRALFPGYLELLTNGTTTLLASVPEGGRSRGAPALVKRRPSHAESPPLPPEAERDFVEGATRDGASEPRREGHALAVTVTVTNADLSFIHRPLLLGHYRAERLTGTERVVDRLIGGTMRKMLAIGSYPREPGSVSVFINQKRDPFDRARRGSPPAVIVVGLGQEGSLSPMELVASVREGVKEWAHRLVDDSDQVSPTFRLSATLLGSGGIGVGPGQAAQLITQGVHDANRALAEQGWPQVEHLELVELYLDRATEAWRALQVQAQAAPWACRVTDEVRRGDGALRRPLDASYRATEYDMISADARMDSAGATSIQYTIKTRRARSEVHAQKAQVATVSDMVAQASAVPEPGGGIARALFRLLVPLEMEPLLGGSSAMLLELTPGAAAIPWELLDPDPEGANDAPWAIRTRLLRKLRTREFRHVVRDASADDGILVIGEPRCPAPRYAPLPAAREEAWAVFEALTGKGKVSGRVERLIGQRGTTLAGPDHVEVNTAILARDWRVIHIAGHGEPPRPVAGQPGVMEPGGVVLSKGYLGAEQIAAMRVVPELVFVNCCYLGASEEAQFMADDSAVSSERPRFAATVAHSLIEIGVRCVIAAGWAVNDRAARAFATSFYDALLRGRRFIDAVAQAREQARALGGNTWAAYQCYGDPDWTFRSEGSDAQGPAVTPLSDEYGSIASPEDLAIALHTLAVQARYQRPQDNPTKEAEWLEDQHTRLRYLEERFGKRWGTSGAVACDFGNACAELSLQDEAIAWYKAARGAADGGAAMKATEQLANHLAQRAWRGCRVAGSARARAAAAAAGLEDVGYAVATLEALCAMADTSERRSLLGSAHKRRAMILRATGAGGTGQAIRDMLVAYTAAELLARKEKGATFYPAMNRVAAEVALHAGEKGWKGLAAGLVTEVRDGLARQKLERPDFWNHVGETEQAMFDALAAGQLAARLDAIIESFDQTWERVKSPRMWHSVLDQAEFVLAEYGSRAAARERAAADRLLTYLRGRVKGPGTAGRARGRRRA